MDQVGWTAVMTADGHHFLWILLAHGAEIDKADEVRVAKFNPYLTCEIFSLAMFLDSVSIGCGAC